MPIVLTPETYEQPVLRLHVPLPEEYISSLSMSLGAIFRDNHFSGEAAQTALEGGHTINWQGETFEFLIAWDPTYIDEEMCGAASKPRALGFYLNSISNGGTVASRHYTSNDAIEPRPRGDTREKLGKAAMLILDEATREEGFAMVNRMINQGNLHVNLSIVPTNDEAFRPGEALMEDLEELTEALKIWLSAHHVDFERWGQAGTKSKSVMCLAKQIQEGEALLCYEGGKVYIEYDVVLLDARRNGGSERIYESSQYLKPNDDRPNGEMRLRRSLGGAVAEKRKGRLLPISHVQWQHDRELESEYNTLRRLMHEELQLNEREIRRCYPESRFHKVCSKRIIEPSQCFPGCNSRNRYSVYMVELNQEHVMDQYIEDTPKQRVTIGWTEVLAY